MEPKTTPRTDSAATATSRAQAVAPKSQKTKIVVPIREIGARYRPQVLQHLLALEPQDRYLRFGYAANDRQIETYVASLNFERDRLFGIFNRKLELVGLAHLAYPADASIASFAEFGVSVAKKVRGRGFGARLFERCAVHAANDGVKTMYIHALSENTAMLRIARNAGATVERDGSESEAHLSLPVATFRTRMDELVRGQMVGRVDYFMKTEFSLARSLLATFQEVRNAVRENRHKSGT
ncbi:GNAT family N-acetyltransferase [Ottowia sp.]|uniref:GNAT family N-acetyltransferase n=1 Tax=Ottowia sp. TaxID=1898956 RepID=UPI003A8A4904